MDTTMMNTTNNETGFGAVLDSYAKQGQFFLNSAANSFVQFGRVLTEAKPLVPHGQWEKWVSESFGMTSRSAQGYMKAWAKYGNDPQLSTLQYSKLREMMSLPEGTQEKFLAENDVSEMTSREVKEAVKKVREELQSRIDEERRARENAERKCEEIAAMPSGEEEQLLKKLHDTQEELNRQSGELNRIQDIASDAMQQRNRLQMQLSEAQKELSENEELLSEYQDQYDRLQNELLNTKSMMAKGDAERTISESMNADQFAQAVRAFMGAVSQVPYMGGAFATMANDERALFDQYLKTVEGWAVNARKALDTIHAEVVEL